jgi:hypothetical protein
VAAAVREPGARLLATSDCERCRPGLVSQPVNTASSVAYVAAGAAVLAAARRRPERARTGTRAVGWSLVAVGIGSVAYHGPGGTVGRWLHDSSLLAMSGMIALSDVAHARGTGPTTGAVAAVTAAAGLAAHPRTSGALQVVTAAAALGAAVNRHVATGADAGDRAGSPWRGGAAGAGGDGGRHGDDGDALAAALFAAGLGLHAAGRTGRPLCRPDTVLQPHAAWHVLSAAALWLRTRTSRGPR